MLRAAEREAGARQEGATHFIRLRHDEALRYAARASQENRRYAAQVPQLAGELDVAAERPDQLLRRESTTAARRSRGQPSPSPEFAPSDVLGDKTLALLYKAGVPAYFLETLMSAPAEPASAAELVQRLRLSSRNARRYAGYLERSVERELTA
jgi:hypothetical protein